MATRLSLKVWDVFYLKTRGFPSLSFGRFGFYMKNKKLVRKNHAKSACHTEIAWISYSYTNYQVKTTYYSK